MNVKNDVYIYRDFKKVKSQTFAFKNISLDCLYYYVSYKKQGKANEGVSEVQSALCEDADSLYNCLVIVIVYAKGVSEGIRKKKRILVVYITKI